MTFPEDYPFNPPTFRFNNEFYHPNGNMHTCNRTIFIYILVYSVP